MDEEVEDTECGPSGEWDPLPDPQVDVGVDIKILEFEKKQYERRRRLERELKEAKQQKVLDAERRKHERQKRMVEIIEELYRITAPARKQREEERERQAEIEMDEFMQLCCCCCFAKPENNSSIHKQFEKIPETEKEKVLTREFIDLKKEEAAEFLRIIAECQQEEINKQVWNSLIKYKKENGIPSSELPWELEVIESKKRADRIDLLRMEQLEVERENMLLLNLNKDVKKRPHHVPEAKTFLRKEVEGLECGDRIPEVLDIAIQKRTIEKI